jgi:hypothetical protein
MKSFVRHICIVFWEEIALFEQLFSYSERNLLKSSFGNHKRLSGFELFICDVPCEIREGWSIVVVIKIALSRVDYGLSSFASCIDLHEDEREGNCQTELSRHSEKCPDCS